MNKLILIIIGLIIVGWFIASNYTPTTDDNISDTKEYIVDESDILSPHTFIDSVGKSELSEVEILGLLQMREEEKLAHDVYMTLYNKWNVQIFSNIAESEQTHTNTIAYLLNRYDIEDPVKSENIGSFTDTNINELYNVLVEQGLKSKEDAFFVGATIEDLDIKDLNELSLETDNQDILIAYENLTKGSRNHLRAFAKQLSRYGEEYSAQYLTQSEIDEILSGSPETGNIPR